MENDGMTEVQDFAKAYLDQWQQQWSQLAADPAWQQLAQQQWQQFAQSIMSGGPLPPMPTAPASAKVKPDDPTRAAAPSASPDLGAQLLAECFMRLARLEARVADLESRVSK